MTKKPNVAASVKNRLLNIAKANQEEFTFVLTRYAHGRFLYRLSISDYKDRFLLKGAFLFTVWFDVAHRPTKDLDLLGYGSRNLKDLEKIFAGICGTQVDSDDGIVFLADTIKGGEIREGEEYRGVRINLTAILGAARIPLQIDVGFGDAVTPSPKEARIPDLLDFPSPRVKVYPVYTVVAEKFEAMVKLGIANSRMKDFWDVRFLANEFQFEGELLREAIIATFDRRKTSVPSSIPTALTDDFANDNAKLTQWRAFLRRNKLDGTTDFSEVIGHLRGFLIPVVEAVNQGRAFNAFWSPAEGWEVSEK